MALLVLISVTFIANEPFHLSRCYEVIRGFAVLAFCALLMRLITVFTQSNLHSILQSIGTYTWRLALDAGHFVFESCNSLIGHHKEKINASLLRSS